MKSNGSRRPERPPVSPLLQGLLADKQITSELAVWADEFPTLELQDAALHRYREECTRIKDQIKAELLVEAPDLEAEAPTVAPVAPVPKTLASRISAEIDECFTVMFGLLFILGGLYGAYWLVSLPFRLIYHLAR